jgi:uncharacterized membrane protein YgcG
VVVVAARSVARLGRVVVVSASPSPRAIAIAVTAADSAMLVVVVAVVVVVEAVGAAVTGDVVVTVVVAVILLTLLLFASHATHSCVHSFECLARQWLHTLHFSIFLSGGRGGGSGGAKCFAFEKGNCDRGGACRFSH